MPKHPDGSMISSYFNLKKNDSGADVKNQGMKTLIGQVEKVHFVDDPTNVSKTFVEYDVMVRNEQGGQTTYKNVRQETALGGFNDKEETILEPNEVAFSGRLDPSNIFANKNGTFVYVSFRDGSLDKPYIEGSVPHSKTVGASRADGIRKLGEFRGVQWNINSDGELIITYKSNRTPDGKLVRENTGPTVVKIDKTGAISFSDNAGQLFKMDRVSKTFSFSNGTTITFDGKNDAVNLVTSGGVKLNLDGKGDKAIVKASKVNLGDDAPSKSAAIGESVESRLSAIENALTQFIMDFNLHTHPTAAPGGPSPPTVPESPFMADTSVVSSSTVKVKE